MVQAVRFACNGSIYYYYRVPTNGGQIKALEKPLVYLILSEKVPHLCRFSAFS